MKARTKISPLRIEHANRSGHQGMPQPETPPRSCTRRSIQCATNSGVRRLPQMDAWLHAALFPSDAIGRFAETWQLESLCLGPNLTVGHWVELYHFSIVLQHPFRGGLTRHESPPWRRVFNLGPGGGLLTAVHYRPGRRPVRPWVLRPTDLGKTQLSRYNDGVSIRSVVEFGELPCAFSSSFCGHRFASQSRRSRVRSRSGPHPRAKNCRGISP